MVDTVLLIMFALCYTAALLWVLANIILWVFDDED